jgi:hypothetical protein
MQGSSIFMYPASNEILKIIKMVDRSNSIHFEGSFNQLGHQVPGCEACTESPSRIITLVNTEGTVYYNNRDRRLQSLETLATAELGSMAFADY